MSDVILSRDDCRLCGGGDLELVLHYAPTPIVDAFVSSDQLKKVQEPYPLDLYLCRGCGHAQLRDVIDPKVLYVDYIYDTSSSLGLDKHFQEYASDVVRRVGPPEGALAVDLGSNDGTLLKHFEGHGMRVLGVDPAVEIAKTATAQGLKTLPTFFTGALAQEIRRDLGPASVVTVNHLFANLDDVVEMAEGIRSLLAPDGVFVFETFYLADLIQNLIFDFIYHEHLNCYSVKPLDTFLRRHGMEIFDIEQQSVKGGSMRGFVQLAGGPRDISPNVARLVANETKMGVQSPQLFKDFSARIDSAKSQIVSLLTTLKAGGKSIAGYGAAASTTTLIYQAGIGDFISFLVDDNPAKQHLFSPGQHIPVLPSEALYEKNPDYMIILAWRYARTIIGKHQRYLDNGGRFIVPLPEVEVI